MNKVLLVIGAILLMVSVVSFGRAFVSQPMEQAGPPYVTLVAYGLGFFLFVFSFLEKGLKEKAFWKALRPPIAVLVLLVAVSASVFMGWMHQQLPSLEEPPIPTQEK